VNLGGFSISLSVADLAASRTFYERLGFGAVGGNADEGWLIMQNERAVIGLFHEIFEGNHILTFNPGWDQEGAESSSPFTDVRAVQAALLEAGVELIEATDPDGTGPAHIVLDDPDGNRVMIDQFVDKPT
jgi:catechol 2,3-dioxygenase-like lactoylglutathione lyase family enzyme